MSDNKNLKPGWKIWRFEQIAQQITERAEPEPEDSEMYIGLEHMDPGSLKIRRWGSQTDLIGTKFRMRKGDVLFARRNAYLKRVAIAPHDGLFSAHGMVLRPKPKTVLPEFLPFFMQSDLFMDRAIEISVGSLSPTINWKNLAQQEFALPPLEEQAFAVDAFSSAQSNLESVEELHTALRKVYFASIDSKYDFGGSTRSVTLEEVTSRITDGVHKKPSYVDSGVPFLVVENLTRGPGIDLSSTRFVSREDHKEFTKRTKPERGDVLVSKDGTLGVARLIETDVEFSIFVSLALLKPMRDVLDGRYLRYFFDTSHFRRRIGQKTSGSAILHIHLIDFRKTELPLPSLGKQRAIADEIQSIEDSLAATSERIAAAGTLAKELRDAYLRS